MSKEEIREYFDTVLNLNRQQRDRYIDEITLSNGESIIVAYPEISITSTERSKPQIRIFAEKIVSGFTIAKSENKRFFAFSKYSKDPDFVSDMNNINLNDYIISFEADYAKLSGRYDIRSMYEWLNLQVQTGIDTSLIRCNKENHSCGIERATFIQVKESLVYIGENMEKYLLIFDMRSLYFQKSCQNQSINDIYNTEFQSPFSLNRIIFGAPGTGKSHRLEEDKFRNVEEVDAENGLYEGLIGSCIQNYERVTFHPDYSYANFVGTYKPVPIYLEGGEERISYKYVPGPFMRIYVKALKSAMSANPEPYLLIIEEINRANVSSVFGDIFQLLDRKADGTSEYSIQVSEDMKNYLIDELGDSISEFSEIRLPNNLFIWATMNSADQGVFPMDTAFKRRWDFTYLGIDDNEEGIRGNRVVLGKGRYSREVEWNDLRKLINSKLESFRINEDKLLGPYFISEDTMNDPDKFKRTFKNKVIMYLFEDAAKHKRSDLFSVSNPNIYSKICHEFDEKGVAIFGSEIADRFQVPNTQNVQSEDLEAVNDLDETDEE